MVWSIRINGSEATTLPEGSFVLGRAASCNMVCSDPAVSSTHCILFCDGPKLTVEDRSTNGTYVNGFRLLRGRKRLVVSGDNLALVKGAPGYILDFADEASEAPRKLRKLSVLGDDGSKVSASQALAATLRSQDVSLTYRDTELDSGSKDIPKDMSEVKGDPPADAQVSQVSQASIDFACQASPRLSPRDTPLDLDVDAASLPGSFGIEAVEPRGRKRRLERAPSRPGQLSGPALLQWLKRRRCERQGDIGDCIDIGFIGKRSGDRRKAEENLKKQVHFFKEFQGEDEITLLSPPEMVTSLRCRKKPKSVTTDAPSDGFVAVLSSTRLMSNPAVAAQATDQWDAIHKSVVTEATKAFTRSKVMCSKVTNITFPWKTHEMLQETLDWECALQMLQDRCDLEPGRRALMRCGGAQPKGGLFEDPPQGSPEATAAAAVALQGCLPALATGNEFRAATFLNTTGLAQLLRLARPGVLGTWNPIQISRVHGFKDILHCLWSARELGFGIFGHFVGRMTQAMLTKRAFGPAGGQEHCQCSCGQWLTKNKFKGHSCEKHVGKPHESKLKLFWQSRGVLALRVSFKHHSNPPAVDLQLEAALESALKSILWSDFWEAAHVTCSWRLCGEVAKEAAEMKLKPPCCESVPAPPRSHSLSPQQLLLLGWMRAQETRDGYSSRQVLREDLCETDLYLELLVERDFREKGGLIFSDHAGSSIAQVAPLLALLQHELPAPRKRGRCLLDAPGTLVLMQGHSLPCWKAALEQAGVKVLCIQNQKRMRSLAVADILAADFILASLQLFSAEGYQRHFDALAKPGLELWCAPPEQTDPVEAPSPSSTASAAFGCGDVVQLHGLEKQADLNGRKGRLLEWQSSSGRWSCLLHPEKRKRREVKQVLVNVRPCNVKAVQGEGKRPAVTKRRPVESQAKASKYYAELRAREDYMARRQVDLERQTLRLLQQASSESTSSGGAAVDLANSGAVLEMFRFNRLVLDDGHLLVRDLEILKGAAVTNLSQYLAKVAPLYAVHAITANSRWCLSDLECLKSGGHEVVAPFASLLGIQVPWGDASEAQRFLDSWAAAIEDGQAVSTSGPRQVYRSGAEEVVHQLQFSRQEWVAYLFRWLEQVDPDPKKPKQRAQQVRSLLQLCCEPPDVEELAKEVWAQKCSKDADATLAEEEYADFELRLQVFKTLAGRDTVGLEREVLLAASHSSTEQLQALAQGREPLDVQLRRFAQAAVEGQDNMETIGFRPPMHAVNCQACDRLARPKELATSLRLAQQRALKAQEKTTRRWRLLQVLLEAAGLQSPDASASLLALCHCGAQQAAHLMACGHVACPGHETCNCEGKEVAVSLDFQKCKDSSISSKIDAMVCTVQKILSENPKVQCLVFSQWTSALRKLEEALRLQGIEPLVPTSGRKRGKTAVKSVVLLTTDFLCSEKLSRDRQEHGALDEHAVTRHVFLTNRFFTSVKADILEQRIIEFAKMNQLGVTSTAVLHRFVMSDTIESTGEALENIEA